MGKKNKKNNDSMDQMELMRQLNRMIDSGVVPQSVNIESDDSDSSDDFDIEALIRQGLEEDDGPEQEVEERTTSGHGIPYEDYIKMRHNYPFPVEKSGTSKRYGNKSVVSVIMAENDKDESVENTETSKVDLSPLKDEKFLNPEGPRQTTVNDITHFKMSGNQKFKVLTMTDGLKSISIDLNTLIEDDRDDYDYSDLDEERVYTLSMIRLNELMTHFYPSAMMLKDQYDELINKMAVVDSDLYHFFEVPDDSQDFVFGYYVDSDSIKEYMKIVNIALKNNKFFSMMESIKDLVSHEAFSFFELSPEYVRQVMLLGCMTTNTVMFKHHLMDNPENKVLSDGEVADEDDLPTLLPINFDSDSLFCGNEESEDEDDDFELDIGDDSDDEDSNDDDDESLTIGLPKDFKEGLESYYGRPYSDLTTGEIQRYANRNINKMIDEADKDKSTDEAEAVEEKKEEPKVDVEVKEDAKEEDSLDTLMDDVEEDKPVDAKPDTSASSLVIEKVVTPPPSVAAPEVPTTESSPEDLFSDDEDENSEYEQFMSNRERQQMRQAQKNLPLKPSKKEEEDTSGGSLVVQVQN